MTAGDVIGRCSSGAALILALAAFSLPFCTLTVTGCDGQTDVSSKTTVTGVELLHGQVPADLPNGIPAAGNEHVDTGSAQAVLAGGVAAVVIALACLLWIRQRGLQAALVMSSAAVALLLAAPGFLRFEGGIPSDPNTSSPGLEAYSISFESGSLWAITLAELAMAIAAIVLMSRYPPTDLPEPRPPGWWRCVGSAVIDTICVLLAALAVEAITRAIVPIDAVGLYWLAVLLVTPAYCIGFRLVPPHATPGAVITEISIVDGTGNPPSTARTLFRSIALTATRVGPFAVFIGSRSVNGMELVVLLCLGVSLFLPLCMPGRRTLHDIAADTRLVRAAGGP